MKNKVTFFTVLGAAVLIPFVICYSAFSWGFVFYNLYEWFVLPVFISLPIIGYWQSVGLMLFISLFKNHSDYIPLERDIKMEWLIIFFSPWITLLVAWLFS
jgi:hypothetical protein